MEIFILGIAFGVLITSIIQQIRMYYAMHELQQKLGKELFDKIKGIDQIHDADADTAIKTRVEEIDGVFYIFDAENHEFMAQGSTMTEIQEHMKARLIKSDVVVAAGDPVAVENFRKIVTTSNI